MTKWVVSLGRKKKKMMAPALVVSALCGNGKEQLELTVGRVCQSVFNVARTVLIAVEAAEVRACKIGV